MKETKSNQQHFQQIIEAALRRQQEEKKDVIGSDGLEVTVSADRVNIAILIGMSEYKNLQSLPQCGNDVSLMKTIIQDVKKINNNEMLYINGKENGRDATDKIINFVNSFSEKKIRVDEVFFYFSGHGSSHKNSNGDFQSRYLFTDYDDSRLNETSIAASYIDSLIRKLSPITYVKIIDSCYSGSRLIKTTGGQAEQFTKGVSYDEEHYKSEGFHNVYVMASSSEDQVSYANTKFSDFSESFFLALQELEGDVKYRHVINRLADYFSKKEQRPSFVTQGPLDGGFGTIKDSIKGKILAELTEEKILEEEAKPKQNSKDLSSLSEELIKITRTRTFTRENFNEFIDSVENMFSEVSEFSSPVFESSIDYSEDQYIPNEKYIGEWIADNRDNFFAKATYEKKEITESKSSFSSFFNKTRKEVDGFAFEDTDSDRSRVVFLTLRPRETMNIMESISIYAVIINSAERVFLFHAGDKNKLIYWDKYEPSKISGWTITEITDIKNKRKTAEEISSVKNIMTNFIIDCVTSKISEKSM